MQFDPAYTLYGVALKDAIQHIDLNQQSEPVSHTCQGAGVPEGANLRVGETGQQRDDVVHHVLVVNDAVLALSDKHLHKLTEVHTETLPVRTGHDQGVVSTVLQTNVRVINTIQNKVLYKVNAKSTVLYQVNE